MFRRQLVRWGLVVALVPLLSVGALWWSALADAITPANAARIKPGISLTAVNQLLGQQGQCMAEPLPYTAVGENHYVWEGMRGAIHVAFRGDLTVADPAKFTATDPQSFRARLCDWLGW